MSTALNETAGQNWGAACQSAAQSPVWTATSPYPASYTQPENPNWYTRRAGDNEDVLGLGKLTTTEEITAQETGVSSKKEVVKRSESGGRKIVGMSAGGLMCAFLALSILLL